MIRNKAKVYFFDKAFTIVELLVVIGILVILMSLTVPFFRSFRPDSDLIDATETVLSALRLAQNKTLASEYDGQWGVFFNDLTDPQEIILFRGESFDLRDDSFDKTYFLPSSINISEFHLSEEKQEIVFYRLTGAANNYGSLVLSLKPPAVSEQAVFVEPYGQVSLEEPSLPSEAARIKDSRRVHISYSRHIVVDEEKIILTFSNNGLSVVEEIEIADYLKEGEIYWQGSIEVDGSVQKIKVHTYDLNGPAAFFCVHRDRRYNNRALAITLSGDASGSLIEYSADGLITTSTSIYADNLLWQ